MVLFVLVDANSLLFERRKKLRKKKEHLLENTLVLQSKHLQQHHNHCNDLLCPYRKKDEVFEQKDWMRKVKRNFEARELLRKEYSSALDAIFEEAYLVRTLGLY